MIEELRVDISFLLIGQSQVPCAAETSDEPHTAHVVYPFHLYDTQIQLMDVATFCKRTFDLWNCKTFVALMFYW